MQIPQINLTVRNRENVLFEDKVEAVTSYNDKGVFDILPEHESFISIIKEKVIIHKTLKDNREIKIDNGVLKVYENNVNIYVNFEQQP